MESIYTYENYRTYLRDYYDGHKQSEPGFSWRVFARRAGFGSPVFLKLVIDGTKNLGAYSIDRVAAAMQLSRSESLYFHAIVAFTHADTDAERNYHFSRMSALRTRSGIAEIQSDQFEYYSAWYIPVVREVLANKSADTPPEEIGTRVRPAITVRQVRHAIDVLLSTGLITTKGSVYRHSSALLATDPQVQSLAVRNFHESMLGHATSALREVSQAKRSISGLTLRISEKGYVKISRRIDEFRDELLRMAAADTDVDRVYQVGLQLFPVSDEGIDK